MRTILITGGTGLIGKALVRHLHKKNYRVIILTRSIKDHVPDDRTEYALWNPTDGKIDEQAVRRADGIIHLAGAGVMDKKWTAAYKKEILESRTKSAELLINSLKGSAHYVKVLVSASATGWYGADKIPGHFFTEDEEADTAFLGEVCRQWEKSTEPAEEIGIRVCRLRTGIVLDGEGGAYAEFRSPLKYSIAPILGNGRQVVSWVHIDDLCRMYIFAMENEQMRGSYNAVSPAPVSNKTLVLTIAEAVKGRSYISVHVPAFVLKIMMGGRSIEILKSVTAGAEKIKRLGFTFFYPGIEAATEAIEKR
jgi:uncharacterized protein (TIGR01777 family)